METEFLQNQIRAKPLTPNTSIAAMSFENVRGRGTIELVGAEVSFSIFVVFVMNLGGQIFQMVYKFLWMGGAGSVNT